MGGFRGQGFRLRVYLGFGVWGSGGKGLGRVCSGR